MRNARPRTAAVTAVLLAIVAVPAVLTASATGPAAATPASSRPAAGPAPLSLRCQLTAVSQSGAGPRSLAFTVVSRHAGPAMVATARVQVSFDGGTTWRPASLHRTGAASFRAWFTAPAGHQVTLRVTVHTRTGASLTETLLGAYQAS